MRKWLFDLFFERKMFKRVIIQLTAPICKCDEATISWAVPHNAKTNGNDLVLTCKKCSTVLHIPHQEFTAGFQFDKKYPKDQREEDEKKLKDEEDKLKKEKEENKYFWDVDGKEKQNV